MINVNKIIEQVPNVKFEIGGTELKELMHETINECVKRSKELEVQETYLTKSEAATKLGVSLATLYRWQQRKYLEPVYVGAKPRYRLSELERILKND